MIADYAEKRGKAGTNWLALALLLLALALYLPTVAKDRVVTDSQAAAASAWRIATTGSPWMEGVVLRDLEGSRYPEMWVVDTSTGHQVHNRTPGAILPAVPFYWALNNDATASEFEIWVGGAAASSVTAVAGLLMFYGLRARFSDRAALLATSVLLFTTPVWSVSANALWTHNLTILAIAGAIFAATQSRWWLMGLFFALGILGRPHIAVIAAVVGLFLAWRRRDWRIALQIGVTSALGVMVLTAWNRAVFGSWSLLGGYNEYVTDNLVSGAGSTILYSVANHVGFVMSADRGLLVWSPVVLILLPSMLASWKALPDWVRSFVIAGLIYSLLQLRINSFQGGQNFYGYRLGLELIVCMAPALLYAYKETATATRFVIGGLIGIQFAAIAIGAAADDFYVTGGDMWTTNAFVVALGEHPLLFGTFTAACCVIGVLVTYVVLRTTRSKEGVTV